MKVVSPFPTFCILLPEDLSENHDHDIISYWKSEDTCLLQLSSVGTSSIQQSASQRLFEQTMISGRWKSFELRQSPCGCESAAATMNADGVSYLQVYLVWPTCTVHATVSRQGQLDVCQWVWDLLASVQPKVTNSCMSFHFSL
jgi:hypothetical protein